MTRVEFRSHAFDSPADILWVCVADVCPDEDSDDEDDWDTCSSKSGFKLIAVSIVTLISNVS